MHTALFIVHLLVKIKKKFVLVFVRIFTGGSVVQNLSAMQKTQVWSLGWVDRLEKGMAAHSRILPWRIPWTEEPGGLQSEDLDTTENTSTYTHTYTHTLSLSLFEWESQRKVVTDGSLERLRNKGNDLVTQLFRISAGPKWKEYYRTSRPTLQSTHSEIERRGS